MNTAKRILKIVLAVVIIAAVLFVALVIYLSVTEFKPAEEEKLRIKNNQSEQVAKGQSIKMMTWNVGYGALGDNANFFMDGGKMVNTASKSRVNANLKDIGNAIAKQNPDIMLMQEVDRNSMRSHHVDEVNRLSGNLPGHSSSFAYNFKVKFIPYPLPPIGKVESGIATFSDYKVSGAVRKSLPVPFKWPVRLGNLKRCLLISRMPVAGSDKDLVIINLHLEAFDDGSGKVAQTRELKRVLDQETAKGNYVIAAGDFNQTFDNVDSSMYPVRWDDWVAGKIKASDIGDEYSMLMDNSVPTCRSNKYSYDKIKNKDKYQYFMIDGYIVSKNISVSQVKTIDLGFKASDHNPVTCTFTLN